jgi:hypothetical protein
MKNPKNSLDSQLLKWSGAALVAFFVAVFAAGSHVGASAREHAQPAPTCQAQAGSAHGTATDACRS